MARKAVEQRALFEVGRPATVTGAGPFPGLIARARRFISASLGAQGRTQPRATYLGRVCWAGLNSCCLQPGPFRHSVIESSFTDAKGRHYTMLCFKAVASRISHSIAALGIAHDAGWIGLQEGKRGQIGQRLTRFSGAAARLLVDYVMSIASRCAGGSIPKDACPDRARG